MAQELDSQLPEALESTLMHLSEAKAKIVELTAKLDKVHQQLAFVSLADNYAQYVEEMQHNINTMTSNLCINSLALSGLQLALDTRLKEVEQSLRQESLC